MKIAKVLGIVCVVVVSSKTQLLEVLNVIPTVQALSVSSRNMRLWKVKCVRVRLCVDVSSFYVLFSRCNLNLLHVSSFLVLSVIYYRTLFLRIVRLMVVKGIAF